MPVTLLITADEGLRGGKPVPLVKLDKHTWQAAPLKPKQALTLHYEVYAWDLSVRGAHLDTTHAFFNGTSVFLAAAGFEHLPHEVEIVRPAGRPYAAWRIALWSLQKQRNGDVTALGKGIA